MPQDFVSKFYKDATGLDLNGSAQPKNNSPTQANSTRTQLQSDLSKVEGELNFLRKQRPFPMVERGMDPTQARLREVEAKRSRLIQSIDRVNRTGNDYADNNNPTALDTVRNVGGGILRSFSALTAGFAGDAVSLTGGDRDNILTNLDNWVDKTVASAIETTGGRQRREDSSRRTTQAGESADTGGVGGFAKSMSAEISQAIKEVANSPLDTALPLIAAQIPNLLGISAVGRAAAKKAASKAFAKGASLEAAKAAGTKAGGRAVVGAGADLQGTSVGADALDRVLALPIETLQSDPNFQNYIQQGLSEDEARKAIASDVGRKVGLAAAAISVITNKYLPTAEKSLVGQTVGKTRLGRAAITGAGEAVQETFEEGGGQFVANVGLQSVDPTQRLGQGVGEAVVQSAIASGPIGGVTGLLSPNAPNPNGGSNDNISNENLDNALRNNIQGAPTQDAPLALPSPDQVDLDSADDTTPLRVKGLNLTPRQILESAQQNASDPRVANILGQPIDGNIKAQQIARIYNGEDAQRAEGLIVPKITPLVGGKNSVSTMRAAIETELSQYGEEVIAESPVLSGLSKVVEKNEADNTSWAASKP